MLGMHLVLVTLLEIDIDFRVREAKQLMGYKTHHDVVKPTTSLEWRSVLALPR